jgi:hypothetical protein
MVNRALLTVNVNIPAFQNFLPRHHLLILLDLFLPSHDHSDGSIVELGSSSAAKHLHNFKIGVLFHALIRVGNCVLDNHKMTWKVHTNGEGARAAYHIDIAVQKTSLDGQAIVLTETGVMKSNSSRDAALRTLATFIYLVISVVPFRTLSPTATGFRDPSQ